jgi:hypothetical protein
MVPIATNNTTRYLWSYMGDALLEDDTEGDPEDDPEGVDEEVDPEDDPEGVDEEVDTGEATGVVGL